jgi:hypothetical protein
MHQELVNETPKVGKKQGRKEERKVGVIFNVQQQQQQQQQEECCCCLLGDVTWVLGACCREYLDDLRFFLRRVA